MTELPRRQADTLEAIRKWCDTNPYPPSLTELGGVLGLSKQGARTHVLALVEKGLVVQSPGRHGGVIPTEKGGSS